MINAHRRSCSFSLYPHWSWFSPQYWNPELSFNRPYPTAHSFLPIPGNLGTSEYPASPPAHAARRKIFREYTGCLEIRFLFFFYIERFWWKENILTTFDSKIFFLIQKVFFIWADLIGKTFWSKKLFWFKKLRFLHQKTFPESKSFFRIEKSIVSRFSGDLIRKSFFWYRAVLIRKTLNVMTFFDSKRFSRFDIAGPFWYSESGKWFSFIFRVRPDFIKIKST